MKKNRLLGLLAAGLLFASPGPRKNVVLARAGNLRIVLTDGLYFAGPREDFNCPSGYYGNFTARVTLGGKLVETPLGNHTACDGPWRLTLADYNRDGQPDFNLGEQENSVSSFYELFTIRRDGRVEPLKVHHDDGSVDTSITATTTGNSTNFEITAEGIRARSGEWTTLYVWRGGMFEEGASVRKAPSRK